MEWRARGMLLWSRAVMAGGFSFVLGVLGHVGAEGLLPGAITLTVLAALSIVLAAAALSRPASYLRLVGLVLTLQAVTHLFLGITAGHRGDPAAVATRLAPGAAQLPTVDGRRVGSLLDAYAAQAGHQVASPALPVAHLINDISANLPMVIAHTIASILVGLWLGVGERGLWSLLTLLAHRLITVVCAIGQPVRDAAGLRPLSTSYRERPRRTALLLRADPRRGPPLLSA